MDQAYRASPIFKFQFYDGHAQRIVATQRHSMPIETRLSDARDVILSLVDAELLAFAMPVTGDPIPVPLEQDITLQRVASASRHIQCIIALRR